MEGRKKKGGRARTRLYDLDDESSPGLPLSKRPKMGEEDHVRIVPSLSQEPHTNPDAIIHTQHVPPPLPMRQEISTENARTRNHTARQLVLASQTQPSDTDTGPAVQLSQELCTPADAMLGTPITPPPAPVRRASRPPKNVVVTTRVTAKSPELTSPESSAAPTYSPRLISPARNTRMTCTTPEEYQAQYGPAPTDSVRTPQDSPLFSPPLLPRNRNTAAFVAPVVDDIEDSDDDENNDARG